MINNFEIMDLEAQLKDGSIFDNNPGCWVDTPSGTFTVLQFGLWLNHRSGIPWKYWTEHNLWCWWQHIKTSHPNICHSKHSPSLCLHIWVTDLHSTLKKNVFAGPQCLASCASAEKKFLQFRDHFIFLFLRGFIWYLSWNPSNV